jgi:hypothetical protein
VQRQQQLIEKLQLLRVTGDVHNHGDIPREEHENLLRQNMSLRRMIEELQSLVDRL